MGVERQRFRRDSRAERFEAIFEASSEAVLRYALRRGSGREEAEEVVAETFLVAWRRFAELPGEPLPWLYGTARRVLANRRRAAGRRGAGAPVIPLEEIEVADPRADGVERLGEREALAHAFAVLGESDREVLALTAWEGLAPREAAEALGVTAPVLSVRLHRARRRLLRGLAESGHPLITRVGREEGGEAR